MSLSVGTKVEQEDGNTNTSCSPARNWFFTANNFSKININEILDNKEISRYAFQEEIGKGQICDFSGLVLKEGTPHLQGYVEFHEKIRPKHKFSKRFHWEIARNTHACIEYCSSTGKYADKQHGKQWTNILYIKNQVSTIKELRFWQERALDKICNEDNDRNIWWFYDTKGGIGKSAFCKYLCVEYDAIILSGKASDMKYAILKRIEKGRRIGLVILDIPRESFDYVSYSGIEEIKNGCFFSSKYEGGMCLFEPPTVVCFANERPDHNTMSRDRWKIFKITNEDDSDELTEIHISPLD